MSTILNQESYRKLIEDNIAVLNASLPKESLERQHIEFVLRDSVTRLYPRHRHVEELNHQYTKLDEIFRSGKLNAINRERVAAMLDTIRWMRAERGILSPVELAVME